MLKFMKKTISFILCAVTLLGTLVLFSPTAFAAKSNSNGVMTFSKKQDGNTYLSKNFQVKEFACKDGSDTILIDPELVIILQKIRDHFEKPITINSAYRTASYNKKIHGATNSNHVKGMAADIRISGVSPKEIAAYAETIGVHGIGLYETSSDGYFVHVDTRTTKSYWYGQAQKRRTTFGGNYNSKPYAASSMVNMTSCPSSIKQGGTLKVGGTVISTSVLESAACTIIKAKGTTVQSASISTNGKYAKINLSFSKLSAGEYTLRITTDNGALCTRWEKSFCVTGTTNSSPSVKITCNLPSSIRAKKSCNLTGMISAVSGKITSAKAYILNANGDVVQSVSYTPYATTLINITKCKLNTNLKFGQLKVGTYTLKIVATDNNGNSTTWTQQFSVK